LGDSSKTHRNPTKNKYFAELKKIKKKQSVDENKKKKIKGKRRRKRTKTMEQNKTRGK